MVTASPFKEVGREIPLAGVGEDDDDHLPLELRPAGDLAGRVNRRSRWDPGEDTLFPGELTAHRKGVRGGDPDDLVDEIGLEHPRHEPGPDPLDTVRPGRPAGEDGRFRRLDGDRRKRGSSCLDDLSDPGDRPARPDTGDGGVDGPVGVPPDLLGRRPAVNGGVRRVLELLGYEVGVRVFGGEPGGMIDRPLHTPGSGREDHLSAQRREEFSPFHAHRLGHRQDERVAPGCTDERKCDPGVPARRLDDRRPLPDLAGPLGLVDHRDPDPVLHAPHRVERLDLGEDRRPGAFRHLIQPDERRVPDRPGDIVVYPSHHYRSPSCHSGTWIDRVASDPGSTKWASQWRMRRHDLIQAPGTPDGPWWVQVRGIAHGYPEKRGSRG